MEYVAIQAKGKVHRLERNISRLHAEKELTGPTLNYAAVTRACEEQEDAPPYPQLHPPPNVKLYPLSRESAPPIFNSIKTLYQCQKKITTDFLSKRQKPNEGEAPQYYIEQSHEAIIPPDEWEIVQLEMARRKALGHKYSGNSIFSARLVCADCGEFFGPKVWNSTSKYRRTIWQCNGKFKGARRCTTPHLDEETIKAAFVQAFNSIIQNKAELIRNCQFVMDRYTDCKDLDAQRSRLEEELAVVTGLIQKWVKENAQTAQDTEAFMAKCREYDDRYRELQSKVEALEEEKRVRQGRVKRFELFLRSLKKQHGELSSFDESTWLAVIETVLVKPDGKLVFRFANGMDVER